MNQLTQPDTRQHSVTRRQQPTLQRVPGHWHTIALKIVRRFGIPKVPMRTVTAPFRAARHCSPRSRACSARAAARLHNGGDAFENSLTALVARMEALRRKEAVDAAKSRRPSLPSNVKMRDEVDAGRIMLRGTNSRALSANQVQVATHLIGAILLPQSSVCGWWLPSLPPSTPRPPADMQLARSCLVCNQGTKQGSLMIDKILRVWHAVQRHRACKPLYFFVLH